MGATDRFSPEETQRIVGLTGKQLDYWDRLRLVSPRKEQGSRFYDFGDLIGLRTVKQLVEEGVPANCGERLPRFVRSLPKSMRRWRSCVFFPMERVSLWSAAGRGWNRCQVSSY